MATCTGNCERWNPHGRGNLGEAVALIAPLYGEGMSVTPYKRERLATNLPQLIALGRYLVNPPGTLKGS